MARRKEGDLFFSGVLHYKSGAWTSSQQYNAHLKFESSSGPKRLDLYPLHGNPKLPGAPSTTIPLTHVLGVISNKQHHISRTKNTFQILTTVGRYQFGARSPMEKSLWTDKLDQILHRMPLDNRTYEFNVNVYPTTHSDKLNLKGQYILKVTDKELHLFTASGALQSQFWSPLGSVHKAHYWVLPTSEAILPFNQLGLPAGASGPRSHSTRTLLIITTERTAPIGQGGFAFLTESAKDIAAIIMKRREARIKARASGMSLVSDGDQTTSQVEDTGVVKKPTLEITKMKLKAMNSLPISPSTEREELVFPPQGRPRDCSATVHDDSAESIRQKERAQASMRVCARQNRTIPLKDQLQKASRQNLDLDNHAESLLSPDEPHFITNRQLAEHQKQFHEWKKQNEEEKNKMSRRLARGTGQRRRLRWAEQRNSSLSAPETLESSIGSSIDGEYVFITRGWDVGSMSSDEGSDEGSTTVSGDQRKDSSDGKLKRQRKIDISSPTDDVEFVGIRPRTNAISDTGNTSPTHMDKQTALKRKQQSLEKRSAGRERVCTDQTCCFLASCNPMLTSTQQKSSSDPELRRSELVNSHEYLTILPPDSPKKKAPKKPIPTPRTHKPEKPVPESLPLYVNTFHATPPTLPPSGNPVSYAKMGLDILMASQRSLSESNLVKQDTEDNEYVDMTQFQQCKFLQPHYINYSEMIQAGLSPPLRDPEMTLRGKLRQQKSGSVGDTPRNFTPHKTPLYVNARGCVSSFMETEDIYENGQHCMEYYLYGNTSNHDNHPGSYDSGLGSTPSCSPLLGQRSFSLNDVSQAGSVTQAQHWEKEADVKKVDPETHRAVRPEKVVRKPCKWLTPLCARRVQGEGRHYENLPLMATS